MLGEHQAAPVVLGAILPPEAVDKGLTDAVLVNTWGNLLEVSSLGKKKKKEERKKKRKKTSEERRGRPEKSRLT